MTRVSQLYDRGRPVFSFEFFPPKTDKGVDALFRTLRELAPLEPDFVSVTCPLDKPRRPLTFGLVARIKAELGIEAVAHLVTVDYSRAEIDAVLRQLRESRIENVLALRGDLLPGMAPDAPRDFPHAAELARLARKVGFCVGGAAHPELHPESRDWDGELRHAAAKVDAGCEFLVTQLFFDCGDYFRYVERARRAGIRVPIVPGIMPVGSVPGIKRMAAQNRNRIPDEFLAELDAVAEDEAAVHRLGVQHATTQCEALLAQGVPGIHFYTLNKSPATREILTALRDKGLC
ncbi:MAG TPA: methylenetetrahydrofolate reductase [Myxococcota bacterium]|nr:methylenetetrahydrofolate reductase [Myxococcota bacterium]